MKKAPVGYNGVESREWTSDNIREYVNTLRFVISLIDDYDLSIDKLKLVLQECIDRELIL